MDTAQGGSVREKSNSASSAPVSAVASFWRDFDLEKERAVLDEQVIRIAENQENSQKNRRKLAESTRDILLEKDSKLSELESENQKMKVELEEFRTEATHLKNQQATIRRLEEWARQLEQQMEEKVKEIVEIKQHREENQKTLEVLKERERMLQDQLLDNFHTYPVKKGWLSSAPLQIMPMWI